MFSLPDVPAEVRACEDVSPEAFLTADDEHTPEADIDEILRSCWEIIPVLDRLVQRRRQKQEARESGPSNAQEVRVW
jgi:hypothetical protein